MKPNVWKISSVIIILIMMARNIHTSSGTCKIEIREKTFYIQENYWLTVNDENRPDLEQKLKYVLCSFQPKGEIGYYLFDMRHKRFICTGKSKQRRHKKLGRAISNRQPTDNCLLTESIEANGYTRLYGPNRTELHLAKRGVVRKNQSLMLLDMSVNLHGKRNYCSNELERYCTKHKHLIAHHRMRQFREKFCDPSCWT